MYSGQVSRTSEIGYILSNLHLRLNSGSSHIDFEIGSLSGIFFFINPPQSRIMLRRNALKLLITENVTSLNCQQQRGRHCSTPLCAFARILPYFTEKLICFVIEYWFRGQRWKGTLLRVLSTFFLPACSLCAYVSLCSNRTEKHSDSFPVRVHERGRFQTCFLCVC